MRIRRRAPLVAVAALAPSGGQMAGALRTVRVEN